MVRVCLECKNEYEAKRETSKFCSDNCRVKWNNKNGKKNKVEIKPYQMQSLYNDMKEVLSQIKNGSPITDKPIYQYPLEEKQCFRPQKKTVQQFLNEISELEFEPEYKAKRLEIEQSSLTSKQKELLYSNMRSSKM